jgi:hypothetical protein
MAPHPTKKKGRQSAPSRRRARNPSHTPTETAHDSDERPPAQGRETKIPPPGIPDDSGDELLAQAASHCTRENSTPRDTPAFSSSEEETIRYSIPAVNRLNKLDAFPSASRRQLERPWFSYDVVDPCPKYRRFSYKELKKKSKLTYVSPGEEPNDLSDNSGDDKKPVDLVDFNYM